MYKRQVGAADIQRSNKQKREQRVDGVGIWATKPGQQRLTLMSS